MPNFTLTPETLAMIAGVVLSLLFSYVPGLNTWFAGIDKTYKSLIMLALLLLTSASIFLLSCYHILNAVTCDQPGLLQLIWTFILAVIANQSTFIASPQTMAVRDAKVKSIFQP